MLIIGLDVSSTVTGVAVVKDGKLIKNEGIDLKKLKNFFTKAEHVERYLEELAEEYQPDAIYIEEPLKAFASGLSSASTIASLTRFNGLVSWLVYKIWGKMLEYVSCQHARKLYGVVINKVNKENGKDAAFRTVIDKEPDFRVNYNRLGNVAASTKDMSDAVVIARAGEKLWSQGIVQKIEED
jgi:Holliday junction resolvasome RuvABC endonuclease subunit